MDVTLRQRLQRCVANAGDVTGERVQGNRQLCEPCT